MTKTARNLTLAPETEQVIQALADAMSATSGEKSNFSAALRRIVREWAHEHAYHPDGTFTVNGRAADQ